MAALLWARGGMSCYWRAGQGRADSGKDLSALRSGVWMGTIGRFSLRQ